MNPTKSRRVKSTPAAEISPPAATDKIEPVLLRDVRPTTFKYRVAGKASVAVECDVGMRFSVSAALEALRYPEESLEGTQWLMSAVEEEYPHQMEVGEIVSHHGGFNLTVGQGFEMYAHCNEGHAPSGPPIDRIYSIEELRAFFCCVAALRERMQAAGFDV